MGRDWYYLIAPLFTGSAIRVGGGRVLNIHAPHAGDDMPCIASVRLNGRELDGAWRRRHEIAQGGELELLLTDMSTGLGVQPPPMGGE